MHYDNRTGDYQMNQKYVIRILITALMAGMLISGSPGDSIPQNYEHSAPGYHPGLFGKYTTPTQIPAILNNYENSVQNISNIMNEPLITYDIHQGNITSGIIPVIIGHVMDGGIGISVNISGRMNDSETFDYLATVPVNEQGIFIWNLSEGMENLTEFEVKVS